MGIVLARAVNSRIGVSTSRVSSNSSSNNCQPVNSAPYGEVNGTGKKQPRSTQVDNKCHSLTPIQSQTQEVSVPACEEEPEVEELLVPAMPERTRVERGYITPQQVYNLLNAEAGQPALHDPNYILILDCRSADRYKQSHLVTARASVTVIHPELGCLISCVQLQEFSIILLYAEEGHSPVGSAEARVDSPVLQHCFFQISGLGMDPVILLGGFTAFHTLYPFLCTSRMVLLEPERHSLTIYPSEILEGALYQGSAAQASNYRIIKNLHVTHVVNATADCPDAFPNILSYLKLPLSDDAQQDLVEALPRATGFIAGALRGQPAGRVLVHCSMGRSRSSALTLAFLMQHQRWSLLHAVRWLKERRACTAPNVNFLRQLLTYEEHLFGQRLTSLDDIRL